MLRDRRTRYQRIRQHYRDREVASGYEAARFLGRARARRNRRELAAVERALARVASLGTPLREALDVPCGTGRLFPSLGRERLRFVGADISLAMMEIARARLATRGRAADLGLVQCEGEHLPFRDGAFDCVLSLRFMFHLDPAARRRIVCEMARVSRRWLIIDFRHKYTTRYLTRLLRRRLGMLPAVEHRFSRPALEAELRATGLRLVEIFPCRPVLHWFSDKWVVLIELDRPAS